MATITIPSRAVTAAEFVSAAVAVPGSLTGALVQMTSCPEWSTASGWFSWAIEESLDGGATWSVLCDQGYSDPHALAIGALGRGGALPNLAFSWSGAGHAGARVRGKMKTDAATLHCAFLITTTP